MTFEQILETCDNFPACDLYEITGGEPMLQKEVLPLMTLLCDRGKTVLLETGGSLDLAEVDPRVRKIIDIKPPASGESKRNRWENLQHLQPHDEIKCVIQDRQDYQWARARIEEHNLAQRCTQILLSPVFGKCDYQQLAHWILEDALPVRMQLQLHKYIWDPQARGV